MSRAMRPLSSSSLSVRPRYLHRPAQFSLFKPRYMSASTSSSSSSTRSRPHAAHVTSPLRSAELRRGSPVTKLPRPAPASRCPTVRQQQRRHFASTPDTDSDIPSDSSSSSVSTSEHPVEPSGSESVATVEPQDYLNDAERAIFEKLRTQLEPTSLEVRDISGGCGTMYALSVTSSKFQGQSVIKQHRLVNSILGDDIKGWHGVQLKTGVP